jgi:hypothetical protein
MKTFLRSKLARCCRDESRKQSESYYVPGGLLLPREDPLEIAAGLARHDFNEKRRGGVRARACKTGYFSLILTAWGGSMISPAAPGDGDFIDI